MAKPKKEEIVLEIVESTFKDTDGNELPPIEIPSMNVATVTWKGGVREYTKAIHGKDFKKLAEEFAAKKEGTVA